VRHATRTHVAANGNAAAAAAAADIVFEEQLVNILSRLCFESHFFCMCNHLFCCGISIRGGGNAHDWAGGVAAHVTVGSVRSALRPQFHMVSRFLLICAFVPPAYWAGHSITIDFQLNKHHHKQGEGAVHQVQLSSKDPKSCVAATVHAYDSALATAPTSIQQICSNSGSSADSATLNVTSYNILAQTFAIPETFCPELSKSCSLPLCWPLHRPHPVLLLSSYRHPRIYADLSAIMVMTVMMVATIPMHVMVSLRC
jgi:hypothetical protein